MATHQLGLPLVVPSPLLLLEGFIGTGIDAPQALCPLAIDHEELLFAVVKGLKAQSEQPAATLLNTQLPGFDHGKRQPSGMCSKPGDTSGCKCKDEDWPLGLTSLENSS